MPTTFDESLRCPDCGSSLALGRDGGRCGNCGRTATIRGGRIYDFSGELPQSAADILGWTAATVGSVEAYLTGLADGQPASAGPGAIVEAGIVSNDSGLTATGRKVAYHLAEYRRQSESHEIDDLRVFAAIGPESRVLDVGCGAGQTLRLLASSHPAELVGVDIDAEAIALGSRLTELTGEDIRFVRSKGNALPFDAGRFTHAICRVALNYMNQRRVIAQLLRVLRPGGFLYCLIEGPGFDLSLLGRARGWRRRLCCLRNLAWGVVLEAVGWQPSPGRSWSGDRAFATPRGVRRLAGPILEPVRVQVPSRFAGLPTAYEYLARKRLGSDQVPATLARGNDLVPFP